MANNLGRVQGGGFYASTSYSETNMSVSSVTVSNVSPLVGDTIINADGAACRITAISGSEYIVTKYGTFRPATSLDTDAVHFTPQTLTVDQQGQARANINAQVTGDYATKAEINDPVTADVVCPHEYEITGNTGDEHGLAVGDRQMLLTKIQGQTRRKSLNLLELISEGDVTQAGLTYSIANGVITVNGTSTDWFSFLISNTHIYPGTYTISLNSNKKIDQIKLWGYDSNGQESINLDFNDGINTFYTPKVLEYFHLAITGSGAVFDKVTLHPMFVTGSFTTGDMPTYEIYNDTLVSSKCDFLSTGRNLANLTAAENLGDNHYVFGLGTLQPGTYYIKTNGGGNQYLYKNDKFFVNNIENGATFTITEKSGISIDWYQYNPVSTVMLNYGSAALPYEPYKAENLHFNVPLGQWDYWQGNRIYRQTDLRAIKTSDFVTSVSVGVSTGGMHWMDSNTLTVSPYSVAICNLLPWEDDGWGRTFPCLSWNADGTKLRMYINSYEDFLDLINKGLQIARKLAAQTTEVFPFAGGYAVYNGGLQQQVTENIPYILYKRYSLNMAAQLLANVEIDKAQQSQLNETVNVQGDQIISGSKTFNGTLIGNSEDGLRVRCLGQGSYNEGITILPANNGYSILRLGEKDTNFSVYALDTNAKRTYFEIKKDDSQSYAVDLPDSSGKLALTNEVLLLTGGNLSGPLVVDPGGADGYREGIRINKANNGWAAVLLGNDEGTSDGNAGGFTMAVNRDRERLILSKNGLESNNDTCVTIDENNYLYERGQRVLTSGDSTLHGSLTIADNGNITDGARINVGDDAYITDVDKGNCIGIIGLGNQKHGGIALGDGSYQFGHFDDTFDFAAYGSLNATNGSYDNGERVYSPNNKPSLTEIGIGFYECTDDIVADTIIPVAASDFGLNKLNAVVAIGRKDNYGGYPGVFVVWKHSDTKWDIICDRDTSNGFWAIGIGE